MTALIAITQLLPFQYLAVLPVTLFLIVTGIAVQRDTEPDQAPTYRR